MFEALSTQLRLVILFMYLCCIPISIFTIFLMGFRWRGRFNIIWKTYFFVNFLTVVVFSLQLYFGYLCNLRGMVPGAWSYWSGWLVIPLFAHLWMFYARTAAKGVIWDFTTVMLFIRVALLVLLLPIFYRFLGVQIYAITMFAQALVWLFGFIYYLIVSIIFLREQQSDYSMLQALHLSPFGLWTVVDSGEELFVNEKMEDIFSHALDPKLRGRDWLESYRSGEPVVQDSRGRQYLMEPQETILHGKTSTIWSFSDVTEYRKLLAETQSNSELLSAVNEIVEEMLTSIDKSLQVQEATNMARHIHDVLAQELSIVGITVETLAAKEKSSLNKRELVEMINSLLLRLERRALMQEEEVFSNLIAAFANIGVEIVISGKASLSYLQEHSLFLILREAATNAVRHGGANYVEMLLKEDGNFVMIEIINNGTAYKLEYEEGMGIQGMREKMLRIGGTFAIIPEEGFLIRLTLPRSLDFARD